MVKAVLYLLSAEVHAVSFWNLSVWDSLIKISGQWTRAKPPAETISKAVRHIGRICHEGILARGRLTDSGVLSLKVGKEGICLLVSLLRHELAVRVASLRRKAVWLCILREWRL